MPLDVERSIKGADQLCSQRGCTIAGPDMLADDKELVSTESSQHVLLAADTFQAMRHHFQQLVSASVPECVIDLFELIQIDEQHSHQVTYTTGDAQCLIELTAQQRAIRQAGQNIVIGHALQFFLRLDRLRKIDEIGQRCAPIGHFHVGMFDTRMDHAPVARSQAPHHSVRKAAIAAFARKMVTLILSRILGIEVPDISLPGFVQRIETREIQKCLIGVQNPAFARQRNSRR